MNQQLVRLTDWYKAQCNGEWEHSFGVKIETLDNPGWLVVIDLSGSQLSGRPFAPIERDDSQGAPGWLSCKVEGSQFIGAGGAGDLEAVLEVFLTWAEC